MTSEEIKATLTILKKIRKDIFEEKDYAYADFEQYKVDYLGIDREYVCDELPDDDFRYGMERCIEIIDKVIFELKGENKCHENVTKTNPLVIECKRVLPDSEIESVRNQIKKQLEEGMNEVVILPSGFEVAKDRIVKCRECVHYEKSTNLCTKNRDKVFHDEGWFCADGMKEATKENS